MTAVGGLVTRFENVTRELEPELAISDFKRQGRPRRHRGSLEKLHPRRSHSSCFTAARFRWPASEFSRGCKKCNLVPFHALTFNVTGLKGWSSVLMATRAIVMAIFFTELRGNEYH